MHRFFVPPDRCSASVFALGESDARHASQVLRLGPGDRVEVLDGRGGLLEAEILSGSRKSVEVQVHHRARIARPLPGVVLMQALLKGKAMEVVLEKSVELGVETVILLETDRCVARVPGPEAERKRTAWTQTLIEASKQSRNPWLPELIGPMSIDEALQQTLLQPGPGGATRSFIASLETGLPSLGHALRERTSHESTVLRLAIAIGPEGDFTPAELGQFQAFGAHPVSLGPLVLRAETAAIAAASILGDHARSQPTSPATPGLQALQR
jgi:16S rRNA (uracil1498-N3)-methyltransferase